MKVYSVLPLGTFPLCILYLQLYVLVNKIFLRYPIYSRSSLSFLMKNNSCHIALTLKLSPRCRTEYQKGLSTIIHTIDQRCQQIQYLTTFGNNNDNPPHLSLFYLLLSPPLSPLYLHAKNTFSSHFLHFSSFFVYPLNAGIQTHPWRVYQQRRR